MSLVLFFISIAFIGKEMNEMNEINKYVFRMHELKGHTCMQRLMCVLARIETGLKRLVSRLSSLTKNAGKRN